MTRERLIHANTFCNSKYQSELTEEAVSGVGGQISSPREKRIFSNYSFKLEFKLTTPHTFNIDAFMALNGDTREKNFSTPVFEDVTFGGVR